MTRRAPAGRVVTAALVAAATALLPAALPAPGPPSPAAGPVAAVSVLAAPGAAPAAVPLPDGAGCIPPPVVSDPAVPWAQQQLAPQRVWDLTRGGGVVVAVVDTGVDARTPQLAGGRVLRGVDVAGSGGPADTDCYGHGTFVAGIIAAAPVAGSGFAGVAPDATVLPVRVTAGSADGSAGDLTAAALARGIRAAVDGGATVVNVSASSDRPDPELAAAVEHAAERDVVVVASAANGAQEGDPVTYPAAYPTVLAVGAVDVAGQHADFSQTGPYLALVAPGVDVVSIGPGGPGQWQGSGTSYAAPFVAGVAALVRAYRPGLTAEQVGRRLTGTARHPAAALPDPALGWGTVDPLAAVTSVLPGESPAPPVTVGPPPARPAVVVPPDALGPRLAVGGLALMALACSAVVLVARLGRRGRRRGWRRARVLEVGPPGPGRPGA